MKTLITLSMLLIGINSISQTPLYDSLSINNIKARFYSTGLMFKDTVDHTPQYEYPKGSGKSTYNKASMWLMGLAHTWNEIRMAGSEYYPGEIEFYPGPISHSWAYPQSHQDWNYVWKVTKEEIDEFVSLIPCMQNPACTLPFGYTIPDVILNWPAHGNVAQGQSFYMAPFVDYNGDGYYNPNNGDYPCIKGDEAIFTVFNDDGIHTLTDSEPLKVEVRAMHYAYDSPDSALNNTIFSEYTIINFSQWEYEGFKIGFVEDMDIGCPYDDYTGCDVERSLGYCYNSDSTDANGCNPYIGPVPAQGMCILKGPLADDDGWDNQIGVSYNSSVNGCGYEDWVMDNERQGLAGIISVDPYQNPYWLVGPVTNFYHTLFGGTWSDGTPVVYGGFGHVTDPSIPVAIPTKFMFPGNSDTNHYFSTNGTSVSPWSEVTAGSQPGHRRLYMNTGEFTFQPGDVQQYTVARISAMDYNGGNIPSLNLLKSYTDDIRNFYGCDETGMYGCGSQMVSTPEFNSAITIELYPNPTQDLVQYQLSQPISRIEIYDLYGKLLTSENKLGKVGSLDLSNYPSGCILLKFYEDDELKTVKKVIKK